MRENIKYIIESLLFVSEGPITIERIREVVEVGDRQMIRDALSELSEEYETRKGGFLLSEVAGGYQIRTRPEYNEYIKRLIQPPPVRLSKAALETLAIIAYRQPLLRSDIEHLRGVDCGGVLRMLLERKLVRTLGRKEIPGRPLIYGTTRQFLEVFELKDLKELPTPKEIVELGSALEDMVDLEDAPKAPEAGEPEEQEPQDQQSKYEAFDAPGISPEEVVDTGSAEEDIKK
jgi:segregation and condensation protein B